MNGIISHVIGNNFTLLVCVTLTSVHFCMFIYNPDDVKIFDGTLSDIILKILSFEVIYH